MFCEVDVLMDPKLLYKRKLSYLMNDWDDRNLSFSINNNNVADQVIKFFKTESELVYPAKSYFVAIVYAKCMEKYFGLNFYDCLSDKDLLFDDKFFIPYLHGKQTYNKILDTITDPLEYNSTKKTVDYFKREFLIGTNN